MALESFTVATPNDYVPAAGIAGFQSDTPSILGLAVLEVVELTLACLSVQHGSNTYRETTP